jgi:peptidyl-prolyl cis-trans isomerase B (cyclophilin B)
VGIARGPDVKVNNDSQWFVVKTDAAWLNNQYTNFGQVTSGQDVVNGIRVGDTIKKITVA